MKTKSTILATAVLLGILSSCSIPGSDQWKIRSASTKFVQQTLKHGEKMQWGHIERKLSCHVNGHDCKYAEVKYRITSSQKTTTQTLYLLMSEHCDSAYDISDEFNHAYLKEGRSDNRDIQKLIDERLNQELKERGLR